MEILAIILNFLDFRTQKNLISASKKNRVLVDYLTIKECVYVNEKTTKSHFYDYLEYIAVYNIPKRYPKKLKKLNIDYNCYKPITNIPMSVTHLRFNGYCIGCVSQSNIKYLTFSDYFDRPVSKGDIPTSVTHLKFGYKFNQRLAPGSIPSSVTHLKFGHDFNQSIKNVIPNSVICLIFGARFNQPIICGNIPDSVEYLVFGWDFNQSIENCIPESVIHLEFGRRFNRSIWKCIPSSVQRLRFDNKLDKDTIKYCVPDTVKKLAFRNYISPTWESFWGSK